MKKISIYTDGACSGNPGPGGWGAVLVYKDHEREIFGGEKYTTNNRMELMAVIKALEALKEPCNVDIYTDSKYVCNGISDWIDKWVENGWKNSSRKDVKNQDLWRALLDKLGEHIITWNWLKGHAGHKNNERADELARQGVARENT